MVMVWGLGFRIQGPGEENINKALVLHHVRFDQVWGLGVEVKGKGFRIQGSGSSVSGLQLIV